MQQNKYIAFITLMRMIYFVIYRNQIQSFLRGKVLKYQSSKCNINNKLGFNY